MKILGQLSTTNYTIPSASYTINTNTYLSNDYTVTFSSSMSASQMQSMIDAQPKNLNGKSLYFQFSDGTYHITEQLSFNSFYGGILTIRGNASENAYALHTNQAVIISGSSVNGNIEANNNLANVYIYNLLLWNGSGTGATYMINVFNTEVSNITGNYIVGTAGQGYAIRVNQGRSYVSFNYITRGFAAVTAETCATIASETNISLTTSPTYGLIATYGGLIGKIGTQPSGSTAAQSAINGGLIK